MMKMKMSGFLILGALGMTINGCKPTVQHYSALCQSPGGMSPVEDVVLVEQGQYVQFDNENMNEITGDKITQTILLPNTFCVLFKK